ncbi:uncharacterized protein LOC134351020, partial [Mobula hypostoma]|uniref:uncharacterized protein LOC134351020 n=1 Tax=Mobula hypostoma TaxID=723540 RepID=UPI002FC33447
MDLKLASLNVRSVKSTGRCVSAVRYLNTVNADVTFLQECGLPHLRSYRRWSRWWSQGLSVWSGGNDSRASGLGVLLRGGNFSITQVKEVVAGRLMIADVKYRGTPLRLINVYASPVRSERLAVFEQLPKLLVTPQPVVLAGDFNCTIDAAGGPGRLDSTSRLLMETIKPAKLRDACRTPTGGAQPQATRTRSDGSARSRIDFLFLSEPLTVRSTDVTPVFFSDHCLLRATCLLREDQKAGRGTWKLNMRKGIITLIYKQKGEREDIRNWRPISLLNVDYKILSKAIANRVRSALGQVIHPDQTCAVPGRKISDSLALLRDTIAYVQDRGVDACLVSLDQEKAFDRISHTYMADVLSKMGFGEGIRNWIRLLYTDIRSAVQVIGWETDSFPIRSGVGQGCPLSPVLFACCMEPFAEAIRRDEGIRGVTLPGSGGTQVKTSLYMDDVTVFC